MKTGENMNKTFKLYQIHINKEEHDKINAEGHDSVPKHKASLDMKIGLKKDISKRISIQFFHDFWLFLRFEIMCLSRSSYPKR